MSWPTSPFMAQWETPRLKVFIPVYAEDQATALKCAAVVVHLAQARATRRE